LSIEFDGKTYFNYLHFVSKAYDECLSSLISHNLVKEYLKLSTTKKHFTKERKQRPTRNIANQNINL